MKKSRKMFMCALGVMGITALSIPNAEMQEAFRLPVIEAEASETRAYIIEWVYKVMNGHVYKRLYNATTEEYIGDWILVQ